MELLYQVNPLLKKKGKVVIYGIGEDQKKVFYTLIQENVIVDAFCAGKVKTSLQRLFGKKIITEEELQEDYADACVIVSGKAVARDYEEVRALGICDLIVDSSATNESGFIINED